MRLPCMLSAPPLFGETMRLWSLSGNRHSSLDMKRAVRGMYWAYIDYPQSV